MPRADLYAIAARMSSTRVAATDLDPVAKYVSDVFDPMQKNLSTLLPLLHRCSRNLEALKGKDDQVNALLQKYLADTDIRAVKEGLTRYRWRDILEFMKVLIVTLKEIEEPLEAAASADS